MKAGAIEQNLIKNYGKLHEYMGTSLITKVPVNRGDWQIDQFGSVNYKDKVQLSIYEDKVKIEKKPFFWSRATVMEKADRALDHLKDDYDRISSRDKDFKPGVRVYTPVQIETLWKYAQENRERNKAEESVKSQAKTTASEESRFMRFICRCLGKFIAFVDRNVHLPVEDIDLKL